MKVAVIGCGSIGQRHIRNLIMLGVPPTDIDAYDHRTEAFNQCPSGVHRLMSTNPLADEHDAAIICTPADQHIYAIRLCIHQRLPFLCEKPPVTDSVDLPDDLVDATDQIPYMVGYNWRFNREVNALRDAVGAFWSVQMWCDTNIDDWPGRYGDPLLECSHEIDLLRSWIPHGDVQHTMGVRGSRADVTWLSDDSRSCGDAMIDWRAPYQRRRFEFRNGATWTLEPSRASVDQSYVDELTEFLALVRGESIPRRGCTLREAREVIRICEQIRAKVAA